MSHWQTGRRFSAPCSWQYLVRGCDMLIWNRIQTHTRQSAVAFHHYTHQKLSHWAFVLACAHNFLQLKWHNCVLTGRRGCLHQTTHTNYRTFLKKNKNVMNVNYLCFYQFWCNSLTSGWSCCKVSVAWKTSCWTWTCVWICAQISMMKWSFYVPVLTCSSCFIGSLMPLIVPVKEGYDVYLLGML